MRQNKLIFAVLVVSMIVVFAGISIALAGTNLTLSIKSTVGPSVNVNDSALFRINVTNKNSTSIDNFFVYAVFDSVFLNYENAFPSPLNVSYNGSIGEIQWNITSLPDGSSYIMNVNFTAKINGSTIINSTVKNNASSEWLNDSTSLTISTVPLGGGSRGNYTATWAHMLPAQNFTSMGIFDFYGAPYVARGDGCSLSFDEYETSSPGQNCCNAKSGCPNGNVALDMGAVWVDESGDYIAWHIVGAFSKAANVSSCDGLAKQAAFVVEFDADNNYSQQNQPLTGCLNGEGNESDQCYPGADFQIWYFPDNRSTLFMYYNGSNNNTRGSTPGTPIDGISFVPDDSISNTSVFVSVNCTAIDNKDRAINIIVNKSVFNLSNIQLNFETNTFNQSAAEANPIDMLTDNGFASFLFEGPADDQGKCFQFDNNETACTNVTDDFTCIWYDLGSGNGFCDPDFNNFVSGEACFAEQNQTDCDNSALGYCEWIIGIPLPNGSIGGLCVEQFKPKEFSSGDCDDDCFNCFTENQCTASDANGGAEYGGCSYYTDPINPNNQWCDIKGLKFGCSETPRDCFTQAECISGNNTPGVNWTWDSGWDVCKTDATAEICFNGVDDNSDSQVDCDDSQCFDSKECGGFLNTLVGDYQGMTTDDAMMQYFFGSSMPTILTLQEDNASELINSTYNITSFMVVVGSKGLGIGLAVENLSNLNACSGGTVVDRKFIYAIDTDVNTSTGCNITIDSVNYPGYNYLIKYGNYSVANESGQEKYLMHCVNGDWASKPGLLVNPQGDPMSGMPMECEMDTGDDFIEGTADDRGYVAAIIVDKADIGNPKDDMKFLAFIVNTSYSNWDNMSNISALDIIDEAYFTPGTMDFEPVNCFEEPTKCGAEFLYLGGGEYMPFEDCKMPGDEDADGFENCDDLDCSFLPECSGYYDVNSDNTAPKVTLSKVDAFDTYAIAKWTTNEPTNGSLKFYFNSSSCSVINDTLYDSGNGYFDNDFKPWHDIFVGYDTLGYDLTGGDTYFYKLVSIDSAGNDAISACLNFSTVVSPDNISMVFNFTPSVDPENFTGNLSIFINDQEIGLGGTNSFDSASFLDANITFTNPTVNESNNWSITMVGADLTTGAVLNFNDAFLGDSSGDQDDFIGMENGDWLNMVQKMGVDYLLVQIPVSGNALFHCTDNGSNCTDVTNTSGVERQDGLSTELHTVWKIPPTLGFSSYSTGGTSYSMAFTNLTSAFTTGVVNINRSVLVRANHTSNETYTWNFTVSVPANVTAYINGTTMVNVSLAPNATVDFNITFEANVSGSYAISIIATKSDNSSVTLQSSDDITLTYNATAVVVVVDDDDDDDERGGGSGGGGTTPTTNTSTNETETNQTTDNNESVEDNSTKRNKTYNIPPGLGLRDNEKLQAAMEKILAKGNMNENAIKNLLAKSIAISSQFDVGREMDVKGGKTTLKTMLTYNGKTEITEFVIHEIIPKEFAANFSNLTINTTARIEVVEADPQFILLFDSVKPGDSLSVDYEVQQEVSNEVLDDFGMELYGEVVLEEPEVVEEIQEEPEGPGFPWLALIIIVVIAGLIVGGFFYFKKKNDESTHSKTEKSHKK